MRLLQAMAGAAVGGAEAFFERLAIALGRRRDVAQRVIIRPEPARVRRLADAGLDVGVLRFGGFLDRRTKPAFAAEVAKFRPDVVLSWMNRATRFASRPGPRPYVHVARLGGYYDLKYYRHCDHLVGNTPDIVAYVREKGWPAERSHYLPNFVDDVSAPPIPRARFDTPDDAPLLLALGRLHRNKAFDVLIAALADLPGHWLWVGGVGPEQGALEKLAARLGVSERVRFIGWQQETAPLYATADVSVCPSRHEPLGNVIIEAWARGVPVVAAASQGPKGLIDDGESGLLVPVDDADALAAAIQAVTGDPAFAGSLAEAGRAAYEGSFTEAIVVRRYLDFFAAVAH
ncbi:MAG: glycosyl transferase [Rhodospirillaceae bacterium]|nr:glycosyl transferase [Rhodospirillaceae bacterium]